MNRLINKSLLFTIFPTIFSVQPLYATTSSYEKIEPGISSISVSNDDLIDTNSTNITSNVAKLSTHDNEISDLQTKVAQLTSDLDGVVDGSTQIASSSGSWHTVEDAITTLRVKNKYYKGTTAVQTIELPKAPSAFKFTGSLGTYIWFKGQGYRSYVSGTYSGIDTAEFSYGTSKNGKTAYIYEANISDTTLTIKLINNTYASTDQSVITDFEVYY